MSGYNGFSMSNNAVDAYHNGEMPLSQWTKKAIIYRYHEVVAENDCEVYNLSKVAVKILKEKLLTCTSWHHTSLHYNRTDFYDVDVDVCDSLTNDIVKEWENTEPEKKKESTIERWEVAYLVWYGTRNHPHATEIIETVDFDTSKSYVMTKNGRKMIKANGFRFIKKVN